MKPLQGRMRCTQCVHDCSVVGRVHVANSWGGGLHHVVENAYTMNSITYIMPHYACRITYIMPPNGQHVTVFRCSLVTASSSTMTRPLLVLLMNSRSKVFIPCRVRHSTALCCAEFTVPWPAMSLCLLLESICKS